MFFFDCCGIANKKVIISRLIRAPEYRHFCQKIYKRLYSFAFCLSLCQCLIESVDHRDHCHLCLIENGVNIFAGHSLQFMFVVLHLVTVSVVLKHHLLKSLALVP